MNMAHDDSIPPNRRNALLQKRLACDWTQAEMARRAGISRAAVSAIEGEHLTPSVTTAIALARALNCSVEELFHGGGYASATRAQVWAWPAPGDPCRYWEAEVFGRRLLFPLEESALNAAPHDGVWESGVCRAAEQPDSELTLTVATCDPAVGLLAREYARESGFRMLVFPRGGAAAMDLARHRKIHVAALHRSSEKAPERNANTAREILGDNAMLLRAATWEAGVAFAENGRFHSIEQLAKEVGKWAVREPGSAARECLDDLLEGAEPSGKIVFSHRSVADSIRAGWAEAGVCIKFSAMEAGLGFLPLRKEALDFCFYSSLEHDPRIQALIRVLQSPRYRQCLNELPGYSAEHTGETRRI